jgi:hypothetical protein
MSLHSLMPVGRSLSSQQSDSLLSVTATRCSVLSKGVGFTGDVGQCTRQIRDKDDYLFTWL